MEIVVYKGIGFFVLFLSKFHLCDMYCPSKT